MEFFSFLLKEFESYATKVPIELFVLGGSFLEEVIAPIPSPIVMTLAGSIAKAQELPVITVILLSLLGGLGKSLGAWILYFVGDKGENFIITKFGPFLGVRAKDIDNLSKKLNRGWKDGLAIFLARAIPFFPSVPVSLGSGILKIDLKVYLLATFLGNTCRNFIYLYLGYNGLSSYESLVGGFENIESLIQIFVVAVVVIFLGWLYFRRRKTS